MKTIDLFEFGNFKNLENISPQKLIEFKSFLSLVWSNRKIFYDYEESQYDIEDYSELRKQPFLEFNDKKIRARNYIGFIQFEGYRINIFPKIFAKENDVTHNDRKYYLDKIFYWLSYSKKINFPFNEISLDLHDTQDFLELIIYFFSNYTEKILSEKPYSRYEEVIEETSFLKGSLSMPEYIKENLVTGNWHHFYCRYEPFVYNNLFNKIVKYVSKLLINITNNVNNIEKLQNTIFILDEVYDQICTYEDCLKVSFNRLYEDLDLILTMCKMFLSNQTINSESSDKPNLCFLIPMEKLFEEFIFNFIQSELPEKKAKYQSRELFLTEDRVFQLKPDIVIDNEHLIIDTKYKIRKLDDKKSGISQSDMYQMVSYSIRKGYENILLIYPQCITRNQTDEIIFKIKDSFSEKIINIKAINIDITQSKDELKNNLDCFLKNNG